MPAGAVASDPPNRPGAPGNRVAVAALVALHFETPPDFGLRSGLLRRRPRKRLDPARTDRLLPREGTVMFPIALTPPGTSPGAALRSRSPLPFSAPGVYCVRGGAESSPGCRAGADRRWPRCRERVARGLLCPPALSGHRSRAIHRTGPERPGTGLLSLPSSPSTSRRRPGFGLPAGFLRRDPRVRSAGPVLTVCIFGRRRLAFRLL